jgi:hypothetical protein
MSFIRYAEQKAHREVVMKYVRSNYSTALFCPYCQQGPKEEGGSCCGEAGHLEEFFVDEKGNVLDLQELVRNFRVTA